MKGSLLTLVVLSAALVAAAPQAVPTLPRVSAPTFASSTSSWHRPQSSQRVSDHSNQGSNSNTDRAANGSGNQNNNGPEYVMVPAGTTTEWGQIAAAAPTSASNMTGGMAINGTNFTPYAVLPVSKSNGALGTVGQQSILAGSFALAGAVFLL
ncbi:hypothetical protein K437DRAFT_258531 [Tilletiaria anomala UBC 951]|uniref:Uncharacterized protein n=1 Tax=Tilletiaria anomala (strain ATCC 24038 / CBS 436.72 / UBC 951) TaxID=1037660 RepID=A0A066VQD3_TILAU|nr:uncharacterized protein K437DRAFT_258531 [Tilletiaria anomala UBC 951]KDN40785.1 hypothetical protein K437DRAFT_258531 [Tilletiaria anomala UBC 951]